MSSNDTFFKTSLSLQSHGTSNPPNIAFLYNIPRAAGLTSIQLTQAMKALGYKCDVQINTEQQ